MAEEKKRGGGVLQRLVLWLVIAALLGTVWFLASERNERHFRVAAVAVTDNKTHDSELVVERGRFFPTGTTAAPDKIYAPVPLPLGEKPPGEREFDDQNSLDQYLFGLLGAWAKGAVKKGDTTAAAALVERASGLPGLTGAQFAELTALKAELAWDEALAGEQQAAQLLDSAAHSLQMVAAGKGVRALEATQEADRLRRLAQELRAGQKAPAPPPAQPAK